MKALYPIPAMLRFTAPLPENTKISGRHVVGTLSDEMIDVTRWKQPPHLVFANLRRFDLVASGLRSILHNPLGPLLRLDAAGRLLPELIELKAIEEFVKKYGVLHV